jgi:hypothetical protein
MLCSGRRSAESRKHFHPVRRFVFYYRLNDRQTPADGRNPYFAQAKLPTAIFVTLLEQVLRSASTLQMKTVNEIRGSRFIVPVFFVVELPISTLLSRNKAISTGGKCDLLQ